MLEVHNHSEICPVCKGSGIYKKYYDYVGTTQAWSQQTCHGCNGKGWVVVEDKPIFYGISRGEY